MTDFPGFFNALWRSDKWPDPEPFPWQTMLAEGAAGGGWPKAISLPTASGKTACIDAGIFALAATAHPSTPKQMPRRIWFVVDRRIVVDEAFTRAEKIAEKLRKAESGPLKEVADVLRDLAGSSRPPLAVARLRGGAWKDNLWARIPSQPAVICSTVDQIGSSLLFRAYGHSDETASIYAGLAAHDSLILLDEAHCAVPFIQTVRAVARFRGEEWSEQPLNTPFRYCVMSATPPSEVEGNVFPEPAHRAAALDHPRLRERLTARKLARLAPPVKGGNGEFISEAVARAQEYVIDDGRRRVAVMVNRVATAEAIAARLSEEKGDKAHIVLLTGRLRPFDRDVVVSRWEGLLKAGSSEVLEKPIIVVTTQCLEVGADFSFDALVTECASLDALRQRFGRLDRLGELGISAAVILIRERDARDPKDKPDPVYGRAIYETWDWLNEAEQRQPDATVDFGVEALDVRVNALRTSDEDRFSRLLAPASDAPVLLPAHLDLLCQTSPRLAPEPDVALFLHGKDRGAGDVRVVFRTDLTEEDGDAWIETLSVVPPTSPEMLSVPLYRFRRWLAQEGSPDGDSDVEGVAETNEGDAQTARARFLIWRGRERSEFTDEVQRLRRNDIVVMRLTAAGFDGLGQAVDKPFGLGETGLDLAEHALRQARGQAVLRIHHNVLQPWCTYHSVADLMELAIAEPEEEQVEDALNAVLDENAATPFLPHWLKEIITHLCEGMRRGDVRMYPHPAGGLILAGKKGELVPDDEIEDDAFADTDDLRSRSKQSVPWRQHTEDVRVRAEEFAQQCLGINFGATFATAAQAHDLGKLDPRFQLLLRGGNTLGAAVEEPLAKSGEIPDQRRKRREIIADARLPKGFRHEFFSMQVAERFGLTPADDNARDLALHLIASHHGYARPFAPVTPDESVATGSAGDLCLMRAGLDATLSASERRALPPAHRLDSGVADRFWRLTRRYGWWGLAYLEGIFRLADWEASRRPRVKADACPAVKPLPTAGCSEPSYTVAFDALDGANPLAFLASLGALRVLTRALPQHGFRLSWHQRFGAWRPLLWSAMALNESMIASVLGENSLDLSAMFSHELLDASAERGPKNKKGEPSWKDKLLFPIHVFRDFCFAASQSPSACAEFAATWAGETFSVGEDDREVARKTRFDFTAGQQAFISRLRDLKQSCTVTDLQRSLFTGWRYSAAAVSMRWDTQDEKRQYALQAVDPQNTSTNPPIADPGANLLAVEALPLFPLVPDRWASQAGFDRRGKSWRWPIWTHALGLDVVRSLVAIPFADSEEWSASRRREFGVSALFESRIVQPSGRYRCFTPARSL